MSQSAAKRAKESPKTSPMVYLLIVLVLVGMLAGMYLVGSVYYTNRFPNGTTVNGIDVSGCKKERARVAINQALQDYVLTIEERDGVTETLTAQQVHMTYEDTGELEALIQEFDHRLWFIDYFVQADLVAETTTVYDRILAEQLIGRLRCFNPAYITPAENAHLAPASGGGYEVKEEVYGNQLREEETMEALYAALDNHAPTINLDELGLYEAPTVFKGDEALNAQLDDLNLWTSAKLTYDFGDDRMVIVDQSVIETWLVPDKKGVYQVDKALVEEWVKKNLAYKFDTFGLTHVVKTHSGGTVTLKGGDYGWCIDRPNTAEALYKAVLRGDNRTMEPSFLYKAKNMGIDDIGGTYVEISIDDQHMWCYKDYKLVVDTPVVTGNPNKKGCETPRGSVWAMDCHKSPATLGTFVTMGYSSYVEYWMSFVGNVGIHDSSWRGSDPDNYGGDIYLTNGSHGCINTPYDAAEKIFEVCSVGTAVVVY